MSRPLFLRPEAEDDLARARNWYNQQRNGLGEEFLQAAEAVFERIVDQPDLYAIVHRDVRRVTMRRFPYVVYYVASSDSIEIIAVLHGARDPGVWRSRV